MTNHTLGRAYVGASPAARIRASVASHAAISWLATSAGAVLSSISVDTFHVVQPSRTTGSSEQLMARPGIARMERLGSRPRSRKIFTSEFTTSLKRWSRSSGLTSSPGRLGARRARNARTLSRRSYPWLKHLEARNEWSLS